MKWTKRKTVFIIGGIALFCFFCVMICPLTNGSIMVVHVYETDRYCPITSSQASQYQIMSEEHEVKTFDCNTADLQEATASFYDGSSASFFIEYDGAFVSWAVPEGYECLGDWNSGGSITTTGTEAVQDMPESVGAMCKGNGNVIIMNGLLITPAPGNNL